MFPQQDAFGVYDPTMPSLPFLSGHSCTSEKNMQVAVEMVRVDCRMSFQLDDVEPMVRGAKNYLEGIQTASRSLSNITTWTGTSGADCQVLRVHTRMTMDGLMTEMGI